MPEKSTLRSQFVRPFITFKWHEYYVMRGKVPINTTYAHIRSMKNSSQKKNTRANAIRIDEIYISFSDSAAIVIHYYFNCYLWYPEVEPVNRAYFHVETLLFVCSSAHSCEYVAWRPIKSKRWSKIARTLNENNVTKQWRHSCTIDSYKVWILSC